MSLTKRAKLLATTMFIGAASLMNSEASENQNTQAVEPTPVVQNVQETSTWDDIGNFFTDIGQGIADGAEWTYDNALKPAGQGIADAAEYVYDGAASGVRAASDYVGITTPEEGSENLRANPMRPAEYEAQQAKINEQQAQEQERIKQMRQSYENVTPGMYNNPTIIQPETTFLEDVGTFFSDVGQGIADGAEWTYDNALKPTGQGIATGAVWTYDNALKPAGQGIATGAVWTYDNALKPAGQGIATGAVWTYDNALEPAGQGIADAAEWTYDNALKPTGQGIATGAGFIYDEALVPTGEAISDAAQYVMRGFSPLPTPEDTAYVETLPDLGTFSDNMTLEEMSQSITSQNVTDEIPIEEAKRTTAELMPDQSSQSAAEQAPTTSKTVQTESMQPAHNLSQPTQEAAESLNAKAPAHMPKEEVQEIHIPPVLINAYQTMQAEGQPAEAPNYAMLTLILPPESVQGPMMKERTSKQSEIPLKQSIHQSQKAALLNKRSASHSLVIEDTLDEPQPEEEKEADTPVLADSKDTEISFKKLTDALLNTSEEAIVEKTPAEKEPAKNQEKVLKKETAALKPKGKTTPKAWVIDTLSLSNKAYLNNLAKYKGTISNLTLKGLSNADYSKINQFINKHPDKFHLDTVSIENHQVKTPTISIPVRAPKYDFSKADLAQVDTIKILPIQNTLDIKLHHLDHHDIDFSNCRKIDALNLSLHQSDSIQDLKLPAQLKKLTLDTDNTALVEKVRQKYPNIEIITPKQKKTTAQKGTKTLSFSDTLRQHSTSQNDVKIPLNKLQKSR